LGRFSTDSNSRPPPCILILHDGYDIRPYVLYLEGAGLRVVATCAKEMLIDTVVAAAPDIIVLDFDCDGDIVERLKGSLRTKHIPIIALAELAALRGPDLSGAGERSVGKTPLVFRAGPR
jgi:hypothetical protein